MESIICKLISSFLNPKSKMIRQKKPKEAKAKLNPVSDPAIDASVAIPSRNIKNILKMDSLFKSRIFKESFIGGFCKLLPMEDY